MATAITKTEKVFYGTSEPVTGDRLCEETAAYPVGTLYVNSVDGSLYIRAATNKLAADWKSLTDFVEDDPTLAAPTLYKHVISATVIDLSWTAVLHGTNYVVEMDTDEEFGTAVEIYNGALGNLHKTGLTTATIYYFRVKAQATGYTDSDWTSVTATTL